VLLLVTLPVGGILAANTGAYAAVAAVTATYLSDFVIVTHALPLGGLSHTWSLAMEEQFYLAWPPFLLFSFRRVSHRVILTTTLGLAVLMLLPLVGGGSSNSGTMFIPFGRGGVLLLGCALAFALNGRTVRHATLVAGASATALALAIVLATNRTDAGAAATLAGVAGSGLIAGILQGGISARALSLRPLVWLGQRSYGVYLWHMPIVYAVADHEVQPSHGSLHVLVPTLAGGIGLAALSFRFVESRFRRPPTSRASDDLADAHRSRDMLVSSSSPALP
jgi:peptidoglycan/LPS O-acetylase OafA/YrhL